MFNVEKYNPHLHDYGLIARSLSQAPCLLSPPNWNYISKPYKSHLHSLHLPVLCATPGHASQWAALCTLTTKTIIRSRRVGHFSASLYLTSPQHSFSPQMLRASSLVPDPRVVVRCMLHAQVNVGCLRRTMIIHACESQIPNCCLVFITSASSAWSVRIFIKRNVTRDRCFHTIIRENTI